MTKAVIFDLDGVLSHTPDLHYKAFNAALAHHNHEPISLEEHHTVFDGLSTKQKLEMLDVSQPTNVWKTKQVKTLEMLDSTVLPSPRLANLIRSLKKAGYKIGCASNCVRQSQLKILSLLGIVHLFDCLMCNEDVVHPKPDPSIYILCMDRLGVKAADTIIVEDSPVGIKAAKGANPGRLVEVTCPDDVTLESVIPGIEMPYLIVPMAGRGSRFAEAGFKERKPFISVRGKPMIRRVHENIGVPESKTVFVCLMEDVGRIHRMFPNAMIAAVPEVTQGTAITVLEGIKMLPDEADVPVMTANSDQLVEWDLGEFLIASKNLHGNILTFETENDPKWSYAATDGKGWVTKVEEKNPISTHATVGIYWWASAQQLKSNIDAMIAAEDRTNGEFYLCPSYNYMTETFHVGTHSCQRFDGLGTPEDLLTYWYRQIPEFISHRGNYDGPNPERENQPDYIMETHNTLGCDVEIDVWCASNGNLYLGHDDPLYEVDVSFLRKSFVWCHAKNAAALRFMLDNGIHCFSHDQDDHTITRRGIGWTYPGKPIVDVAVMPNKCYTFDELATASHVCSDHQDIYHHVKRKTLVVLCGELTNDDIAPFKSCMRDIVLPLISEGVVAQVCVGMCCLVNHRPSMRDKLRKLFGPVFDPTSSLDRLPGDPLSEVTIKSEGLFDDLMILMLNDDKTAFTAPSDNTFLE
jgi:HAD superfamily hydrolase (TIGR01509 family)